MHFTFGQGRDGSQKNRRRGYNLRRREAIFGYVFAMPAILGLFLWAFIPIGFSFFLSLTDWNVLADWKFIGLENYVKLFTEDLFFSASLTATFSYTFGAVIATNLVAFTLALILCNNVRGKALYRTLFYLPTIVPMVAQAILWGWLFNPDFGLFNNILNFLGLPSLLWLADENTVIPSLVLMATWTSGGGMVIYLAGLQGIPHEQMEAVEVDGGSYRHKLINIILPYMSPIIFFNMLMSVIGSLQVFTQAMMMTGGGPNNRSLFYSYYLYVSAFRDNKMGYACAMAWVLFVITVAISTLIFIFFKDRLYFEGKR